VKRVLACVALLVAQSSGCAARQAPPPVSPEAPVETRAEPVPTVQPEPAKTCGAAPAQLRLDDLAKCFHQSVYALKSEPQPTTPDRLITSDRLAAFLARAQARAGRDDEYLKQCASLKIADIAKAPLRVEVSYPEWDDGEEPATGQEWSMQHTTYRFACTSGEGRAEVTITKTYGPGDPHSER
jgi:hypothetical protein